MSASARAKPSASAPAKTLEPKDRIVELKKTVSASRLQCWLQCRLKFYFRYVLKIIKPPTASLHVGRVVHAVLQEWNLSRWRKEPFRLAHFKRVLVKQWNEKQADVNMRWDEGEEKSERKSAWSLLQVYWAETPIKADDKPEAVEVSVEAELPGLPKLIGIIDLVRAGGRIVDFKSTGKTPDPGMAIHLNETQLSCYGVMYRDATGKKESGFELHHLVKTKTPKILITPVEPTSEKQKTRLFRSIESYVAGLERNDFVPSPGFHCAGCEYFRECRMFSGHEN